MLAWIVHGLHNGRNGESKLVQEKSHMFSCTWLIRIMTIIVLSTFLSACQIGSFDFGTLGANSTASSGSSDVETIESAVQATAAISQPKVKVVPTITGMGYASVSSQPAKSINQRRLMAIRAARLSAMRNLTEQVHGIKINSRTTIIDAIVQNDSLRATVDGLIVGAKTVRINPVGADTYEVVLELDQALINTIMKAARS